jgi:hypothetical protein
VDPLVQIEELTSWWGAVNDGRIQAGGGCMNSISAGRCAAAPPTAHIVLPLVLIVFLLHCQLKLRKAMHTTIHSRRGTGSSGGGL